MTLLPVAEGESPTMYAEIRDGGSALETPLPLDYAAPGALFYAIETVAPGGRPLRRPANGGDADRQPVDSARKCSRGRSGANCLSCGGFPRRTPAEPEAPRFLHWFEARAESRPGSRQGS